MNNQPTMHHITAPGPTENTSSTDNFILQLSPD